MPFAGKRSLYQKSWRIPRARRRLFLLVSFGVAILLALILVQILRPLFLASQNTGTPVMLPTIPPLSALPTIATSASTTASASTSTPVTTPTQLSASPLNHFTGGFGIESHSEIVNAAADNIQLTLLYGYSPTGANDPVEIALKAHQMKMIDAMPQEYLYYYECHQNKSCPASVYPELTSAQAVLNDVAAHLQQVQYDPLVVGYWVLDDWSFTPGSGRDLLRGINTLIHQYTPNKPSICGFGGDLHPLPQPNEHGWDDSTAANFSPQGCDMVAFYIYAAAQTTGTYDWTMSQVLPAVFTSLKQRGWDQTKEPLVGIPQVFGGFVDGEPWPTPSASDIETQAKTYCQQGAVGILYYNWTEAVPSPMTSVEIARGVQRGVTACEHIWK